MSKKVLIGPSSFGTINKNPIKKLKDSGFEIIENPHGRKIDKSELLNLLTDDVVGLIAGLETLDDEVLTKSSLKVISRVGSGISNIDKESLKKNNISLFYIPDGPTQSVAELTIANIINLLRKTFKMNAELKLGNWYREYGNELSEKTVLIVGFGKIGQKVGSILKAIGSEIIFTDPFVKSLPGSGFRKVDLHDGIILADIILLHASGNEVLLEKKEFDLMKKGVIICNPARGELINEKDLIFAIKNDIIGGIWLDTFATEPYKGVLVNYEKVICTSHLSSYTYECREKMENIAVDNLISNF